MSGRYDLPPEALRRLAVPLALTRAGMVAERLTRAFWPFATVVLIAVAAVAFNIHESIRAEALWLGGAVVLGICLWTFVRGAMRFAWPARDEALERLDDTLPGRPIAALADTQAIGSGDTASEAVWRAHVARMADRAAKAHAVEPDLNLATRDPFALRYVALTAFVIALLFGSLWRVATVSDAVTLGPNAALASGPAWEGWVEPPVHTGMPTLYLNDISDGTLTVPANSRIAIRLYGEIGALSVRESVSGNAAPEDPSAPVQEFDVTRNGTIGVEGTGGREWSVTVTPDLPPTIVASGELERTANGEMKQPFSAADDYGVMAGRAEIALDLENVDRRYGLAAEPEPRETLVLDLPMTIRGDRTAFEEVLIEDLSKHPWANLPVRLTLIAEDAAGQTGSAEPLEIPLPGRRFFDPVANAIIELRRDILWTRENLGRTTQLMRTVLYKPDDLRLGAGIYLQLRTALRRMEDARDEGSFTPEARDEMAEVLWTLAVAIEEGDLNSALERLRRAQERLSEAMKNGASKDEIDQLMQELADAMQDYMRQLAQQGPQGEQNQQSSENSQPLSTDELRRMMEEIQRLMEEGRMAEAQALLQQLMEMMENLRVTQGQGGNSPGQQSMEDLSETLRDQQELSDDAFRNLQDQFNPGQQGQQGQQGQGQGQQGQGQGQSQEGQGDQQGMGQGDQGQTRPGQGNGGMDADSLANRQEALRRELERQRGNLPGAGTEEGDAARDALDRAGRAMDNAEDALRDGDLGRAIDEQAEAMDALRDGIRNLGEALANESQERNGEQGQAFRDGERSNDPRDPLGREPGSSGQRIGTDEHLLQGEDVYRRAQELLEEIRRRSGDQSRPDVERDYLERLLEQF